MTAYSQETEMVGPINLYCITDEMCFNKKNLKQYLTYQRCLSEREEKNK